MCRNRPLIIGMMNCLADIRWRIWESKNSLYHCAVCCKEGACLNENMAIRETLETIEAERVLLHDEINDVTIMYRIARNYSLPERVLKRARSLERHAKHFVDSADSIMANCVNCNQACIISETQLRRIKRLKEICYESMDIKSLAGCVTELCKEARGRDLQYKRKRRGY